MTRPAILIEGVGLGALTAAASLSRLGCDVDLPNFAVSQKAPLITLNEKTLWMIGDLFGTSTREAIVRKAVSLKSRRLLWTHERIETIPEHSLVISPACLGDTLTGEVARCSLKKKGLRVRVRGRSANTGQPVGRLNAFVWNDIGLVSGDADWCATLALDESWVMLAPTPGGTFTAQVFTKLDCLDHARCSVAEALKLLGMASPTNLMDPPLHADAAPRLGQAWTEEVAHMGDECLALDPIAGDGLGHTIRMAFWLKSLLGMLDLSAEKRRSLYSGRIAMAFRQHIQHRDRFYLSAKRFEVGRLQTAVS